MTRILYMAPDPVGYPKGAAQRIEATVRALAAQGADVTLLTSAIPGVPRLEGIRGVIHHPLDVTLPNFLDRALAFRRAVTPWIHAEPWDAVWFRTPWEGIAAARRSDVPLIYEAHGFPSIELPSHFPAVASQDGLLDKLLDEETLCLRVAHRVITPSRTGRAYLRARGVAAQRIHVIPNAVDLDRFPPAPPPARVPGDPLRLVYLGTLAPWQGIGTLLEALALLRGRLDVRLALVGTRKGPWVRDLRGLAGALRIRGRIELCGPVPPAEVPALLAEAHACAAPLPDDARNAVQGCCPIKILEYMAAGRPVLATRVRPVQEICAHAETGWLVRPGSAHALARGLEWIAAHSEEAEALGARARAEVARNWTVDGFAARVGAVLEK